MWEVRGPGEGSVGNVESVGSEGARRGEYVWEARGVWEGDGEGN